MIEQSKLSVKLPVLSQSQNDGHCFCQCQVDETVGDTLDKLV